MPQSATADGAIIIIFFVFVGRPPSPGPSGPSTALLPASFLFRSPFSVLRLPPIINLLGKYVVQYSLPVVALAGLLWPFGLATWSALVVLHMTWT